MSARVKYFDRYAAATIEQRRLRRLWPGCEITTFHAYDGTAYYAIKLDGGVCWHLDPAPWETERDE